MDLKLPIIIHDELSESVIQSTGMLDLASGEIRNVVHENDDKGALGLPAENESYEFTSSTLSSGTKEVEFRVEVDIMSGTYSVTASDLLELLRGPWRPWCSLIPDRLNEWLHPAIPYLFRWCLKTTAQDRTRLSLVP